MFEFLRFFLDQVVQFLTDTLKVVQKLFFFFHILVRIIVVLKEVHDPVT